MKKLSLIFLIFNINYSFSQVVFYQSNVLEVFDKNNIKYEMPFTGGLHFPVFSSIDLNFDGHKDLIVLDRADNRILTFINAGKQDTVQFFYYPQFESFIPDIQRTILIQDYNRDGKDDIFAFSEKYNTGLKVYKNVSFNHLLDFELVEDQLTALYFNNPPKASIYLSSLDIPVLHDMDGDSDLDILTFYILGNFVDYYKNQSIEKYGVPDSLDFEYAHGCWGYFKEDDFSNNLLLGVSCGSVRGIPERHAGSTMFANDFDNDGDLDLLLGDVESPNIKFVKNGKKEFNLEEDSIIQEVVKFPQNDIPVNIKNMPAIYSFDANNDGINDYLFSPLDEEMSDTFENLNHIWLYLNKGENHNPELNLNTKGFLTGDMLDFGGTTKPEFFDFDQDGDLDLFVATRGNYVETFYKKDRIILIENIGTPELAKFKIAANDYLSFSDQNSSFIYPDFGDVDGDGDQDLLIGKKNGKICFYRNIAPAGQIADFELVTTSFAGIDVGEDAAVEIYDLNLDGNSDLFISNEGGVIKYYENTTGRANPEYNLEIDTFGGLVYNSGFREYVNIEIADIDNINGEDLIIGVLDRLSYFPNIRSNYLAGLSEKEILVRDEVNKFWIDKPIGFNLKAAIADLDGDDKNDMILGSDRGGLLFYSSQQDTINVGIEPVLVENSQSIKIFPNPAKNEIHIETDINSSFDYKIVDLSGKTVESGEINSKLSTLNIQYFKPGVYFLILSGQGYSINKTKKIIKLP